MHGSEQTLLVIGCGNTFSGDDAAGFQAVRMLAPVHKTGGVRFLAMGRAGIEMLDVFDREEHIVFIDAISSGRNPGAVIVTPLPTEGVVQRSSTNDHGWGISEVLALSRSLGRSVPRTTLIGIEVAATRSPLLSPPVAGALEFLLEHFQELRTIITARELFVLEPREVPVA